MSEGTEHIGELIDPDRVPRTQELARNYLEPRARILDVGSAVGIQAVSMALEGYDVTGIDTNYDMLQVACLRGQQVADRTRINFKQRDILGRPFPDETFDAVFMNYVLQDLESRDDIRTAVASAQAMTRPEGYNFVTTVIGTPEDMNLVSSIKILEPGEIVDMYRETGWEVPIANQKLIKPKMIEEDVWLSMSFDEIVAQKPA